MLRNFIRLTAAALAVCAALVVAGPASAGTYAVNSCNQSSSGSLTGWNFDATGGPSGNYTDYFFTANSCGSFGLYRAFQNVNPIPAGVYAAWTFSAPPGTSIVSAYLNEAVYARSAGAYDNVIAVRADGGRSLVGTVVGTDNPNASQGAATYGLPSGANPTVAVRTEMGCQPSANCNPQVAGVDGNEWYVYGTTMTINDPSNPSAGTVGGAGWNATPTDGTDAITYHATDSGSGVKSVDFYVDGVKRSTSSSSCTTGAYLPCPLDPGAAQFTLDTTALAEGDHALKLTVTDYSGNTTDATQTVTIRRKPAVAGPAAADGTNSNAPSVGGYSNPFTQGETATGDKGNWTGSGITYTYQWQRCDANGQSCADIPNATNLTYTAGAADVGHTLVFCVTGTSTGGTTTQCSAPSSLVQADADGDGVPDATDKCPSVAASTADGCPAPVTVVNPPQDPQPQPKDPGAGGSGSTNQPTARGAANGSNATDGAKLTVLLASKSSTMKVGYGKKVKITGRLMTPTGQVIGGAKLTIQRKLSAAGASMSAIGSVTTDASGKFSYTAPAGPSRTIRFGYQAFSNDTSFASTTDVTLLVKGALTLKAPKAVKNRKKAIFSGKVLGGYMPKGGVLVDLQVFFHKQWRTFATPRTSAKGAYKFKYRFTQGAAKWLFRARIRKDSGFPYEVNYSVKRAVRVR